MNWRGQLTGIIFLAVGFLACNGKEEQPKEEAKNENIEDSIPAILPGKPINPYASVDVSPMDMSYYPSDYPKIKMASENVPPPIMRVIYSRPHLQGRHLFTNLLKYGEPWRLGANEATEIQFYRDVTIQGKKIRHGRYVLYCIPEPDNWIIVLNSNIDSWGLEQDLTKDVSRFKIPVNHDHGGPSLEYFTIVFEKNTNGADMIMGWGDMLAKLPIAF